MKLNVLLPPVVAVVVWAIPAFCKSNLAVAAWLKLAHSVGASCKSNLGPHCMCFSSSFFVFFFQIVGFFKIRLLFDFAVGVQ